MPVPGSLESFKLPSQWCMPVPDSIESYLANDVCQYLVAKEATQPMVYASTW